MPRVKVENWIIERSDGGLFLYGPKVEIEIKDFDPRRATMENDEHEGDTYRAWNYELDRALLMLVSINAESHYLAICDAGWTVKWQVSREFVDALVTIC